MSRLRERFRRDTGHQTPMETMMFSSLTLSFISRGDRDGVCRTGLFRSPAIFLLFPVPRLLFFPALSCSYSQLLQVLRGFSGF
jgi:hypothetical protein